MDQQSIPVIELIGEELENFYQLGLKDRENYSEVLDRTKHLIQTPWPWLNKSIQELAKPIVKRLIKDPVFHERMKHFSQGLNESEDEVILALLTPELVSFLSLWMPGVPPQILGCSSYFIKAKNSDSVIHGRILDFPLIDSFDKYERILKFKHKSGIISTSFGASGFPYPAITAFNDQGVSFALHQKFTNKFFPKGRPIFDIIHDLIGNVKTLEEAIEFCSTQCSITPWCFNMSFSDARVLTLDLTGDQLHYRVHQVDANNPFYVCNKLEDKSLNQSEFQPYLLSDFNNQREACSLEKIKKITKKDCTEVDLKDMLKLISTPSQNKEKYIVDSITPSSIQAIAIDAKNQIASFIPGDSPKIFNNVFIQVDSTGNKIKTSTHQTKSKQSHMAEYEIKRNLMLSLVEKESGNIHQAYHHIQMAMDSIHNHQEYHSYIKFFFSIYQYQHEENIKVRKRLLKDFSTLQNTLPDFLKDHLYIFIHKLERELKEKTTIKTELFINQKLKDVFLFDTKLPLPILKLVSKNLIFPRVDLNDVIYAYIK